MKRMKIHGKMYRVRRSAIPGTLSILGPKKFRGKHSKILNNNPIGIYYKKEKKAVFFR
jgi:hypothetical protein